MLYGSYRRVDVKTLLKDSENFAKELKKNKQELENLLGLSAINNDVCVQTSNVSDMTCNTTLNRDEVWERIRWIEVHRDALKFAREELTDQENEAIDLFFFTKHRMMNVAVEEFADKYGIKRSLVYNINNRALRKLERKLEELL